MTPPSEFSYAADVAPLKQQYFRGLRANPHITPAAAAALSLGFSSSVDAQREVDQRASANDVQCQRAMFALNSEREEAARRRKEFEEVAPLLKEFDAVMADSALDHEGRTEQIGRIALRESRLLAHNRVASTALQSARMALGNRPAAPPKPKVTASAYLSSGGDWESLAKYGRDNGIEIEEDTPLPFSFYAGGVTKRREEKEREAQEKADRAQAEKRLANMAKAVAGAELFNPSPYNPSEVDPTRFDSPYSEAVVLGIIDSLATDEELEEARAQNAEWKLKLAQRLSGEYTSGKRTPSEKRKEKPSAADLF